MNYNEARNNLSAKMLELVCEMDIAKSAKWRERLSREYVTLSKAKEAVDKQIPVEATKLKRDVDTKIGNGIFKAGVTVYKCPCCNTFVTLSRKYCDQCGQALKFTK